MSNKVFDDLFKEMHELCSGIDSAKSDDFLDLKVFQLYKDEDNDSRDKIDVNDENENKEQVME